MTRKEETRDFDALKEALKAGVLGKVIHQELGFHPNEQVIYAKAWGITRRLGRPPEREK